MNKINKLKSVKSEEKIKVTQIGSHIGKKYDQKQTLIGLGLGKMHKISILNATPEVIGMINKVKHLVRVE